MDYNIKEKMLYDKLQTKLGEYGILPNNFKFATINLKDIVKDKMLICPFCLNMSHISQFFFSSGLYQCNYCKNRMKEETLKLMFEIFNQEKINVYEFAKWVFNYRLSGFFQKIDFKQWNKKLYEMDINFEFWDNYKKLKGEYYKDIEG